MATYKNIKKFTSPARYMIHTSWRFLEDTLKSYDERTSIEGNQGQMVLVDGKQRLEAVRKFLRNELPVFKHTIEEFEDKKIMLRSSNANFIFKVNNLKTRKEVLQWYLDLNSGGVVHTSEEIEKVRRLLEQEV